MAPAIEVRLRTVEGNEDGDRTTTRTIIEGNYTIEQAKQVAQEAAGDAWEVRGAAIVDQQFAPVPDPDADAAEQQARRDARAAERAQDSPPEE